MTDITELALIAKIKKQTENFDTVVLKEWEAIALVEALEKAQAENTAGVAGMAESYETTISMLRSRIAKLESRTVTVKLPEPFKLAKSSSGLTYYYADEVNEALTAHGIKLEAE